MPPRKSARRSSVKSASPKRRTPAANDFVHITWEGDGGHDCILLMDEEGDLIPVSMLGCLSRPAAARFLPSMTTVAGVHTSHDNPCTRVAAPGRRILARQQPGVQPRGRHVEVFGLR